MSPRFQGPALLLSHKGGIRVVDEKEVDSRSPNLTLRRSRSKGTMRELDIGIGQKNQKVC